ncbi:MAG: hypothetical protein BMS9Abin28_0245 [Anaerolineae bacterium]|nr:MAG: hypothetical protein BMS9Abin28_0245 [Anaerolineae bacterium]
MQDKPLIQELLSAAREHLLTQVIPELGDPGLRFRTRVAANVLAIAERELALAPVQSEVEYQRLVALLGEEQVELPLDRLTQELKDRVAAGEFDQDPERKALIAHLMQTALEKLKIANPRYLARVQAEDE